jgi:hypothetical protein
VAPRGRLRKILSSNDIGKTGSHQAGFHVAKQLLSKVGSNQEKSSRSIDGYGLRTARAMDVYPLQQQVDFRLDPE